VVSKIWHFSAIHFSKLVEFAVRKSKFSLKFVTMWQKFATKENNSYDLCSAFLPTIKTLLNMSLYTAKNNSANLGASKKQPSTMPIHHITSNLMWTFWATNNNPLHIPKFFQKPRVFKEGDPYFVLMKFIETKPNKFLMLSFGLPLNYSATSHGYSLKVIF